MRTSTGRLGDLYEFLPKSPRKASDGEMEGRFPFYTSSPNQTKWTDAPVYDAEALVFATGGAAAVHHIAGPFATSADCLVAAPRRSNDVCPRFTYHYLRWNIGALEAGFRGAGLRHVSKRFVENLALPSFPVREQRRIAEILDKADALRAKCRAAIAQLDTLTQSIFLDMFGDPVSNPRRWPQEPLETFFHFTTGKLDSNAAVASGQYPFFTCSREDSRIDTFAFDCEALLLAGNNATADYSVKHYKGKFNAYQRTYVIRLRDEGNSYEYSRLVLEHRLAELKRVSKGTGTKYLTMELLNRIRFPVPPQELQGEFARRVRALEKLRTAQRVALAELAGLFTSLQQRAFCGALTCHETAASSDDARDAHG